MFYSKWITLLMTGLVWSLGCAPIDADLSADAESDSPGIAPAYQSKSVQFEVGEPWILLKSDIPVSDPSRLQLVHNNEETIAIDFQKNLTFWGSGQDGSWESKPITPANPFALTYDAFTFEGTLYAAGQTNSGVGLFKMAETRQLQFVDEIAGKAFETACVMPEENKIHIIGREESSAFIRHFVWEKGKSFSELTMTNLVPSSAPIDCVYYDKQFFLLYRTSLDNKRPASLWRSPMGINWSKISHDVSTDLGYVSMYKSSQGIVISGLESYMTSKDGKNWKYYDAGAVKFTEKFDAVESGDSLVVLANSQFKNENKLGLWALHAKSEDQSVFRKSQTQIRSGEGAFFQQLTFQSKKYFVKRSASSVTLERLEAGETIVEATLPVDDSTTMQFTSDGNGMYLFSDDGSTRKMRETVNLQAWSNVNFANPIPQMNRPCLTQFEGRIAFVAASSNNPSITLYQYSNGNWLESNFQTSSVMRVESCFQLGDRIGVLAKTDAGKFTGFTIHPTAGLTVIDEVRQLMDKIQSPSEFKVISDQASVAILDGEKFLVIDREFSLRSGPHGLDSNLEISGGYFEDGTLNLLSPSFFPSYLDVFSYKVQ